MKRFAVRMAVAVLLVLAALLAWWLYEQYHERSVAERLAEVVHDEDARVLSDRLTGYLDDPWPAVRARAATAVGRIGGENADSLLWARMADSSLDVAAAAAFAMGLTDADEYILQLLDHAFDMPAQVASPAVASVGRLADSSMVEVSNRLVNFLSHPAPEVRAEAAMALFRMNAGNRGPQLIKHVHKEADPEARAAAVYALARMKIVEARDVYVENLADSDPFVRQSCVRGLGAVRDKEAIHLMAMALNDGNGNVVVEAIRRLGAIDESPAGRHLRAKWNRVEQDQYLVTLLQAMQRRSDSAALPRARALIADSSSEWVVAAAAKYLARIEQDRAVALLDSLAHDGPPLVRSACAEGFTLIADARMVPRLTLLFSDAEAQVRMAAFAGLTTLDSGNVGLYIERALKDDDWAVRSQAISEIGQRRLDPFKDRLAAMSGATDSLGLVVDLRRSLVEAAAAFLRDDQQDSVALDILATRLDDRSYLVRREAAVVAEEVLGEDYWRRVPPARTRIGTSRLERGFEPPRSRYSATIQTRHGNIELELLYHVAPLTVLNFVDLTERGFYDGLTFHRVVPGFVAQGGDPRGDGWGGPGYTIRDEYSAEPFDRGAVGIATSGPDSGGSQFFITLSPQPHLEGRYTVFARVTAGMDTADKLIPGDRIQKITISQAE
jgi:cyclophilin family peptidyl-prolyl cis-trans isomerase/HEAT repeat protein